MPVEVKHRDVVFFVMGYEQTQSAKLHNTVTQTADPQHSLCGTAAAHKPRPAVNYLDCHKANLQRHPQVVTDTYLHFTAFNQILSHGLD